MSSKRTVFPPAIETNDAGTYALFAWDGPNTDHLVAAKATKSQPNMRFAISANATDGSSGIFVLDATVFSDGVTASIVSSSLSPTNVSDVPSWTISLQASGNTVTLSVKGDVAHVVKWSPTQGTSISPGLGAWWMWTARYSV